MIPRAVLWGLAFFAWAALSLLWSSDWRGGAVELANGLCLLAVFLVFALAPRDRFTWIQPVAVWVAGLGAILSFAFPKWYGGFANENFQAEFILIFLPLLFAANGRWGFTRNDQWMPCLLFAGVLVWIVATNISNLKYVGAGFVILWIALLIARAKQYTWALSLLLAVFVAALWSGALTKGDILTSVLHRLELHINTLFMWAASPLWGHGIGSFNVQYPNFQEAYLAFLPNQETLFGYDIVRFAGAAHNEYLQVLSDYGLVGAVLVCGLIWSLIGKWRDGLDVACFASLTMAGLLSMIEFPAQNPHTGALIALSAGVLANGRDLVRVVLPRPVRIASVAAVVSLVVFTSTVSVKTAQASIPFAQMYFAMDERKDYQAAIVHNIHAYNTFSWPRHIRHQLALTLGVLAARDPGGLSIEPHVADEMFRISQGAAGRSTSIEIARIEYLYESGRWQDHKEEISERLTWLVNHARGHTATWITFSKYALLYGDRDQAIAAAQKALTFNNTTKVYRDLARTILTAALSG